MTFRKIPKLPLLVLVDLIAPESGIARLAEEYPEAAIRRKSLLPLPIDLARYAQRYGEAWSIDPDGFILPQSNSVTLVSRPAGIQYDATTTGVVCGRLRDVIGGICDHSPRGLYPDVKRELFNYYASVYMDLKRI